MSLSIITGVGWRWTFGIMAIIGISAALLQLILIKEPPRNRFDTTKKNPNEKPKPKPAPLQAFLSACAEIIINPTCRWICIAGSFRFFGGYAIGYYMPKYFGSIYANDNTLYGYLNSFVVSVGGFISALSGGLISDKYEK